MGCLHEEEGSMHTPRSRRFVDSTVVCAECGSGDAIGTLG
jgi:hypothetical protein